MGALRLGDDKVFKDTALSDLPLEGPNHEIECENETSDSMKKDTFYYTSLALPPALSVNRWSRICTLRFYKLAFANPDCDCPGIYINFDVDEVLLDPETFGRLIFSAGEEDYFYSGETRW